MRRARPDPEDLQRATQDAQRKRVEAGLPAVDPDTVAYEAARAKVKADRAARRGKRVK